MGLLRSNRQHAEKDAQTIESIEELELEEVEAPKKNNIRTSRKAVGTNRSRSVQSTESQAKAIRSQAKLKKGFGTQNLQNSRGVVAKDMTPLATGTSERQDHLAEYLSDIPITNPLEHCIISYSLNDDTSYVDWLLGNLTSETQADIEPLIDFQSDLQPMKARIADDVGQLNNTFVPSDLSEITVQRDSTDEEEEVEFL